VRPFDRRVAHALVLVTIEPEQRRTLPRYTRLDLFLHLTLGVPNAFPKLAKGARFWFCPSLDTRTLRTNREPCGTPSVFACTIRYRRV